VPVTQCSPCAQSLSTLHPGAHAVAMVHAQATGLQIWSVEQSVSVVQVLWTCWQTGHPSEPPGMTQLWPDDEQSFCCLQQTGCMHCTWGHMCGVAFIERQPR
jgi:hypothetical protein